MHYRLEFGGGLGDVFYQLYERGAYNVLRDLEPNDTAEVLLVCLNPFVQELFAYHPKRSQITVRPLGYWSPADDRRIRKELGIPAPGSNSQLPIKDSAIEYHPYPEDLVILGQVEPKRYIVVAPGAGSVDRFIPEDLVREHILPSLEFLGNLPVVMVGRNFDRDGRSEYHFEDHRYTPGFMLDATDKLSVPGTAKLVQDAAGLVTAHSALNLLGWRERIPQLLLYPQSVLDRHARGGRYDQWMFGAKRRDTVHCLFKDYTSEHLLRFLRNL